MQTKTHGSQKYVWNWVEVWANSRMMKNGWWGGPELIIYADCALFIIMIPSFLQSSDQVHAFSISESFQGFPHFIPQQCPKEQNWWCSLGGRDDVTSPSSVHQSVTNQSSAPLSSGMCQRVNSAFFWLYWAAVLEDVKVGKLAHGWEFAKMTNLEENGAQKCF